MEFERVKEIAQKKKDIVFGYIRRCELLLEESHLQIDGPIGYSILLFYHETLDSNILKAEEIDTLMVMFDEQNKFDDLGMYEYKLLYASHTHGDGEEIFKKLCHKQRNLLVFVHTGKNNVWGGYTSVGWKLSTGTGKPLWDDKAFIFSIRSCKGSPPKIFNVTKPSNALRYQSSFYCMFGMQCCYWINADGKSGGTYNSARNSAGEYEPIPYDNPLSSANGFDVESIEVFQLRHVS